MKDKILKYLDFVYWTILYASAVYAGFMIAFSWAARQGF